MALESDDKKPTQPFPVLCGFAVGAMPAMLQLPLLSKIMFWLLGNVYFLIFYLFMVYLPWMIGSILARITGLHTIVPTLFCIFYWTILGIMAGSPKHAKKAWFYIAVAHIFIPMVFLLNAIRFSGIENFSVESLLNLTAVFSQMLGQ
ncbi:MAG: hypothetical protein FD167_5199 [bacterium]|nr:MAG: hypothetical protein FD167_5199 [bacterium]